MAELVDAADSKSASSDRVPVQVRMEAPIMKKKTSDCLFYYSFPHFLQNVESLSIDAPQCLQ